MAGIDVIYPVSNGFPKIDGPIRQRVVCQRTLGLFQENVAGGIMNSYIVQVF